MNYLETPEDFLESYSRTDYQKDVTDVVESVMHVYKYLKLVDLNIDEESQIKVPITFIYKDGFSVPVLSSIPTSEKDNKDTELLIKDYLVNNNCDYSIHLRICYGIYCDEDDFKDKDFLKRFSQYKASIRLIESNNIKSASDIDHILSEYRNVSSTCIDREGVKYQVLLSMDQVEEFEDFISDYICGENQVNLNEVFKQKFISFSLNSQRKFKYFDKTQFHCMHPSKFAISVQSF